MLRVASATLALATVVMTTAAQAQMPAIGVPKGHLRVELGGEFATVNGGSTADAWNADVGAAFLPQLAGAESRIRSITGNASYRLSAGRSSVTASSQVGRGNIHAALGLTRRITLFGTLPFVRTRAQTRLAFDSVGSGAGLNPADPLTGGNAAVMDSFFTEFQAALNTLATKIANGDYNGNPSQLALANQTVAAGNAMIADFNAIYLDPATASPFVPTATSGAGIAMLNAVNGIQANFTALSVAGFDADPKFAAHRLTPTEYADFLNDPDGHVRMTFRGNQILQRPGDAELGLVYTVVDRPALRVAATGLVRLPTGLMDRSENFFDIGTGDGQTDVEGRLTADLAHGAIGARLTFGYNDQLASTLTRRVGSPAFPVAYFDQVASVSRDLGNEMTIGVEPFVRLAPGFALTAGVIRWSHGADEVTYAEPFLATGPASVLAEDTKRSATMFQTGLTYSSFAGILGKGGPIEARWAYRSVISTSGGQVDKTKTMWFQFRAYYKLW
ncbi:MAG TPA: hypothetical protein VL295_00585 [Gemmatimonadales bacterium]|nr:hypothetical protein [Gemmatimonadales bacterium]